MLGLALAAGGTDGLDGMGYNLWDRDIDFLFGYRQNIVQ